MKMMVILSVYYCCVTNYHTCNNFRQHWFITHSAMGHKSGTAPMHFLHKVLPGWSQGVGWPGLFSGVSREEPVFNLNQVLGKFCFLWMKDRGALIPCLLIDGVPLSAPGHWDSFSCGWFHLQASNTVCFGILWLPLLLLARENSLLLKGSPDRVRPTQKNLCILRSIDWGASMICKIFPEVIPSVLVLITRGQESWGGHL